MFTIYVDDSGTSRGQPVAVAGVLIIPARQIVALDRTWSDFATKYGFADLHASECAALNQKSYPGWDDLKVRKVFSRACQIIRKYVTKAFSFSVDKSEFDAVAPHEWRETGGDNHYTWALRNLMHTLVRWHQSHSIQEPFEFVFDRAEGKDKLELEILMAQFDNICPGEFDDHYQFRKRKDVPALQCADLLAWTSYAVSRGLRGMPVSPLALECAKDFRHYQNGKWWDALTLDSAGLKDVIEKDQRNPEKEKFRRDWLAAYIAAKGKR